MRDNSWLTAARLVGAELAQEEVLDRHARAFRANPPELLSPLRRWQPFDARYDLDDRKWYMFLGDSDSRAHIVKLNSEDVATSMTGIPADGWKEISTGKWYLHLAPASGWSVSTTAPAGTDLCVPLCNVGAGSVRTYHHGLINWIVSPASLSAISPAGYAEKELLPGSGATAATDSWDISDQPSGGTLRFPSVRAASRLFLKTRASGYASVGVEMFAFTRKLTFAWRPAPAAISAETRGSIGAIDAEEP